MGAVSVCTCSGSVAHYNQTGTNNMDSLSKDAERICMKPRSQKHKQRSTLKATELHRPNGMTEITGTCTDKNGRSRASQQMVVRIPGSHTSHASHSSFDDEFYLNLAKQTPSKQSEYKCLLYIRNNFIHTKLTYGFMRLISTDNVDQEIVGLVHMYCCEHPVSRLLCIGLLLPHKSQPASELKQDIYDRFKNVHFHKANSPDMLRLRHVWSVKQSVITKAYIESSTLKENCKHLNGRGVAEHLRIFVEFLEESPKQECPIKHIFLQLSRVYRVGTTFACGVFRDIMFELITMDTNEYIDFAMDDFENICFQHHAFHSFRIEYVDYYCRHLPWISGQQWQCSTLHNVSSADYLLFTHKAYLPQTTTYDILV